MTAATLFSGIGAPEVAMPHWRWLWHAEIEKFPSAVMAARHRKSINLGDVTAHDFTQRAEATGRPDVVIFGSPCQDFSVAGKRLGLDGPRGNLALTALRIVAQLRPRWFVFENVPGLLSNWSGGPECPPEPGSGIEGIENGDFAVFIGTVDELRYSGAWASLDAQYRGLAQRRDRLFFVGHSGDWRGPTAVLLEPEGVCGDSPPRRAQGQDAALPVTSRVDRGGSHREAQGNNLIANPLGANRIDGESETFVAFNNTGQGWWNDSEVASPIRTPEDGGSKEATLIAHALRADGFDASEDGTGRGTPLIPVALFDERNITSKANRAACRPDFAPTMHSDPFTVAFSCKDHGADAGEIAPTLRAMGHSGSHPNAGGQIAIASTLNANASKGRGKTPTLTNPVYEQGGVRRLTPRECECLQGFPHDYTLISFRKKPAADGPRYKALGNSMAVPVIRWILNRIEIFEMQVRPVVELGRKPSGDSPPSELGCS